MEPIRLTAYDGVTGKVLYRLPYSSLSGEDSISQIGSMNATVPDCSELRLIPDLNPLLRPYGTIYAATMGDRILHAGYLTGWSLNDSRDAIELKIGGGWTILQKRLVLNRQLIDSWKDGETLIDEDHPPGAWVLTIQGTYRDIIRGLIDEAMQWGPLPISLPPIQGGKDHERNYQGWDFATTWDRISDIADLADGPEIRLDPSISPQGSISFALTVGNPEIVDEMWRRDTSAPRSRFMLQGVDSDGSLMSAQCYAVGGRSDDKVLVCMRKSSNLVKTGWPNLVTADTTHGTVSVLKTLQSYAQAAIDKGDYTQDTYGVSAGLENPIHVGDHIDLAVRDDLLAPASLKLKVTDIKWDAASEFQTLQTSRRDE